ncbi:MAG: hypothetical protein AAGG51_08815 [Cyanobacteria bacterium P01_G01_bin.54]
MQKLMVMNGIIGGIVALGIGLVGGSRAIAQDIQILDEKPVEFQTIPDAFVRGLTFSSQDAYSTTATIGRQFDFLFGFAGFPDSELSRDGSIVNSIYDETMYRQYSLGPLIRTPDLRNPYDSSLRTDPSLLGPSQSFPGGEFIFPPLQ